MSENVPVGRQMDVMVAERVLGWQRCWHHKYAGEIVNDWLWHTPDGRVAYELPRFSSDIAAAWQVVDRLTAMGYQFELSFAPGYEPEPWLALFFVPPRRVGSVSSAFAATAAEAICRAALLAVERTAEYERRVAELQREQSAEV